MHTILDVIIPQGDPVVYRLIKVDGNKKEQIASVLAVSYNLSNGSRYAEVLHIYVEKEYRRHGLAKMLIAQLQKTFPYIITGYHASTFQGKELFEKMGFERKKVEDKPDNLEWRRI